MLNPVETAKTKRTGNAVASLTEADEATSRSRNAYSARKYTQASGSTGSLRDSPCYFGGDDVCSSAWSNMQQIKEYVARNVVTGMKGRLTIRSIESARRVDLKKAVNYISGLAKRGLLNAENGRKRIMRRSSDITGRVTRITERNASTRQGNTNASISSQFTRIMLSHGRFGQAGSRILASARIAVSEGQPRRIMLTTQSRVRSCGFVSPVMQSLTGVGVANLREENDDRAQESGREIRGV